jgi:predicted AAA+ superfamily ATPase
MKRSITAKLTEWRDKKGRMPLVINGARQVGKTYILKMFGEECFENTVYVNLETNITVNQFFESDISPGRIVQYLEAITSQRIIAGKTLIILDETGTNRCPKRCISKP